MKGKDAGILKLKEVAKRKWVSEHRRDISHQAVDLCKGVWLLVARDPRVGKKKTPPRQKATVQKLCTMLMAIPVLFL
jgi:hypothetical protein